MFQRVRAACLQGIQALSVDIEVDSSPGLPGFSLVGLPDSSVRESRERVVAALRSSGFLAGGTRMTVNLSPADLRKEGSAFDLGLAVGMLLAMEQLQLPDPLRFVFLGELSLDGQLRPVRGVLSVAASLARTVGIILVVPPANASEALCVGGLQVMAPPTLEKCIEWLTSPEEHLWKAAPVDAVAPGSAESGPDFAAVSGLPGVKRAMEICAAGGHNFLLVGSPGSGKTLCARCLPGILPPLSPEEALETTMIHSCAGTLPPGNGLVSRRPFRSPHHSATSAALVGGGRLRPGEACLAHHGVLFLDELPEFHRGALESLRQPIEEGVVRVERALGVQEWPARFMLGAAMNPCPCGYSMDTRRPCRCLPDAVTRYRQRISGPLLDRIDVQVSVPSVAIGEIADGIPGERSEAIRARVIRARAIQTARNVAVGAGCNSVVDGNRIHEILGWEQSTERFASQAANRLAMSRRGFHRLLKVARTIADLREAAQVEVMDVAEAMQYRGLEASFR